MREHVQSVMEEISSLGVSSYASTLVDLQQQLVKKAEWIYNWIGYITIEEVFDQALSDHPDLCDVVKV